MIRRLDLLVPGLFGPVPLPASDLPPVPVLTRLLGRADRGLGMGGVAGVGALSAPGRTVTSDHLDPLTSLFALFGIPTSPDQGYPSGPFCRLAEGMELNPGDFVFHADPIHLRPDRNRLVLFAGRPLAVNPDEATALTRLFNQHFAGDGLKLEAPAPGRWYLRVQHPPDLVTTPLHAVRGRPIGGLLPRGPDARTWARILNEVQMLFHQASVNQRREEAGQPAISGIWPWGGGRLRDFHAHAAYTRVFATDPPTLGLAQSAGNPTAPWSTDPADLVAAMQPPSSLVLLHWQGLWNPVLEADGEAWVEALQALEIWLAGFLTGMGGDFTLRLLVREEDSFRYRPRHRYRFWRSPLSLGKRLSGVMN